MNRSLRFGLLPLALALTVHLRGAGQTAPSPDELNSLRADNKQLSDELAAAWKESEKLKGDLAAAQAAAAKSSNQATDLQQQLDSAKADAAKVETPAPAAVPAAAAPAPAPAPDSAADSDAAKQLADAQDKLAVSLRSFSVVQDENSDLKASVDKLTSENAALAQQLEIAHTSVASLQVQAAATSQIEPLRTQVRQSQDEISSLASENEQLRTRLSLQSPVPGSNKPAPMRPSQALQAAAPAAAPAAPAPPESKTYVVVEGDTLTRISRKFYGTSGRWQDILNANRATLKDEKSLTVGSTLKIP
jgi:nucleoid-associated protein YgaU